MNKEDFKTKCPYCQIGFTVMCSAIDKFEHIDIMWSYESGAMFKCEDRDSLYPHIVKNPKFASGFSLSPDMQRIFNELNDDFHKDPSGFSKENVDLNTFGALLGEFFRYSEYMDDRQLDEDDPMKIATDMYDEGKNLKEIMDAITTPYENTE